jgi:hypothetical protein
LACANRRRELTRAEATMAGNDIMAGVFPVR